MVPCHNGATMTSGEAVSTQNPQLVVYDDGCERRDWTSSSSAHWHHLAPETFEHRNAAVVTWSHGNTATS